MFVDYKESILAYINSIRDYFALETFYDPDPAFSALLKEKRPQKIILALIDGMGSRMLKRKLNKGDFLVDNLYKEVSTVFPPTTVAATTAIKNGKSPNMNAWLGWTQYFKEIDDTLTVFMDEGYYSKKKYPDFAKKAIKTETIMDELNAKGIKAAEIGPEYIVEGGFKDLEGFFDMIAKASFADERFVYAYLDAYDSLLHKKGVDAKESDALLHAINDGLEKAAFSLSPGVLLMVVADHGLVDIDEPINIYDTKLKEYMSRPLSIEPRACAFFIKEGRKEEFQREFKALYEDDFILLSKEQVLRSHLFGDGQNHERFVEFIGDFIAIAKKDKILVSKDEDDGFRMKATHAGCAKDELMIPIILYMP